MDLSFWCYSCDCYVENKVVLNPYEQVLSDYKFGSEFVPTIENVVEKFPSWKIDEKKIANIKYFNFIELFNQKKFKNIVFMTGAGISTSAGIPDFRSKGGIFEELQKKHSLETPAEFFSMETFKKNPELLYEFIKTFSQKKYYPTPTHYFMFFLESKGLVLRNYTQNVDGLELLAGSSKEKMMFSHGNLNEAHCPECKKDYPIETIKKAIDSNKIHYCEVCQTPCKPKVVLYGEKLDDSFYDSYNSLKDADLCIIMGTSMKVFPFNNLPYFMNQSCYKMVINNERVGSFDFDNVSNNEMFVEGTTDEVTQKLLSDLSLLE
eukprot:CAMPEP_0170525454 /NCGR_PEP_ID=MMETSP0209-20121228/10938_1 /TAXON_ID=665100 ORGANISM="Litonotus pictus, Strain P1" /NCGR_SAMPLE_ID=MMETSP0209 /ASSEMBLY_ACC=CAM_ASM_000301 /LENGTH=319 /DNA_ID=CAMNT_0010814731 /DNA_START=166 /DNA_END=1122 /DNA_ORIENTATION=-